MQTRMLVEAVRMMVRDISAGDVVVLSAVRPTAR